MSTAYNPAYKDGDDGALHYEQAMQLSAIEGFRANLVMGASVNNIATVKSEENGDTSRFEFFGWEDGSHEYESGNEIEGDAYVYDADTVTLDKRNHKAFPLGETQEEIFHMPVRTDLARAAGRTVAETYERRLHIMAVKAARTASRTKEGITIHAGGTNITRTGGDMSTIYPTTVAGAKKLRDDIFQADYEWESLGIPTDSCYMYFEPYLKNVLFQDVSILDRDLSSAPGDLVGRTIGKLGRFWLVPTTWLPSHEVTAGSSIYADPNPKYQGNFAYNGGTGRPVGLFIYAGMANEKAIAVREKYGFRSRMWWNPNKTVWKFESQMRNGLGVLNPEVAKELRVSS